jgi:hypothetical protein
VVRTKIPPSGIPGKGGYSRSVHHPRPTGLQRQLLLWAGVLAVALGLLAMHHMSRNHVVADPFAGSQGHVHSELAGDNGYPAAAVLAVDNLQPHPAGSTSHHSGETGDTCPGCGAHQAMSLTCLVALTLLAVSALRRLPLQRLGVLVRPVFRAVLSRRGTWRTRPALTLMEISVSRT